MSTIVCPLCRQPLDRRARVWRCPQGHSFDVAREGYVNLLPVQQKNSTGPGDSPDMVMARREFLQAGHYRPLREAVFEVFEAMRPLPSQSLLDIGCGEGDYTDAFTQLAPEVIGLDISKPAIRLAARRFRDITWLVASGAQLPIANGAMDIVCCLFTQLHMAEIHRALKPGGHVLVATPAADHVWSVREKLFDEVRAHQPEKFLTGFEAGFELRSSGEVRFPLTLTQASLRQLLLMTPYVWKARPEKRAALERSASFQTEAAFSVMLFRKN